MKKLLLIALLTGVMSLTGNYQSSQAQAFGPPDKGSGHHFDQDKGMKGKMKPGKKPGKEGFMKMMQDLNLTEEQKEQLKANKDANRDKAQALRDQMRTEREKFMDLMSNVNTSKQELMAQQNKISALQSKMAEQRIDGMMAFRQILTPEQLEKFQKNVSEKHTKMKEMMQKRQSMRGKQGGNRDFSKKNN